MNELTTALDDASGVYCSERAETSGNHLGATSCPLNSNHEVEPYFYTQNPLGQPKDADHYLGVIREGRRAGTGYPVRRVGNGLGPDKDPEQGRGGDPSQRSRRQKAGLSDPFQPVRPPRVEHLTIDH